MRSIFLLVACILLLIPLAYFGNFLRFLYEDNKDLTTPFTSLGTLQKQKSFENFIDIDNIRVAWFLVEDLSKLSLHSNLSQEKTAKSLFEENECLLLINGGFYTKEDTHIGLFVSEGEQIERLQQNKLFNGIFSIDHDVANIRKTTANSPLTVFPLPRLALQAGPILLEDDGAQEIVLQNDEQERRVIVAVTDKKKVIFLVFYKENSAFIGPKLSRLPELLKTFGSMTGMIPVNALNLDGGTASAFYTKGFSLGELSRVGSYFCVLK